MDVKHAHGHHSNNLQIWSTYDLPYVIDSEVHFQKVNSEHNTYTQSYSAVNLRALHRQWL